MGDDEKCAKKLAHKNFNEMVLFFESFAEELESKYNNIDCALDYIDAYDEITKIVRGRGDCASEMFYAIAFKIAQMEKWKIN